MMQTIRTIVAALACLAAQPALAREAIPPSEAATIQQALDRAQRLFVLDQVAWHGTDDLVAKAKAAGATDRLNASGRGWVVIAGTGENELVFFDGDVAEPHAIYRATLSGGGQRVLKSVLFPEGDARITTALERELIAARRAADAVFAKSSPMRCGKAPFNTIVLPPTAGDPATHVYYLTPQTRDGSWPMGGHYRVTVGPGGAVGQMRAFTKTCLELGPPPGIKGQPQVAMLVVSHLLDPTPTELHVFTMYSARKPLAVATRDGRTWVVAATGGRATIRLLERTTVAKP